MNKKNKAIFTGEVPMCPFCAKPTKRHDNGSTKTLCYYPPMYNDKGINTNPDRNSITHYYKCLDCNKDFAIKGNETDGYCYWVNDDDMSKIDIEKQLVSLEKMKQYIAMTQEQSNKVINEAINGIPTYSDTQLALAQSMRKYTKVKLELLVPTEKFNEFSALLYQIKLLL